MERQDRKGDIMKRRSKDFEEMYEECSIYKLDDFDLDSAVVVKPKKKLRKTYPLSLRIHKADIIGEIDWSG